MIQKLNNPNLLNWLNAVQKNESLDNKYRHSVLKETSAFRKDALIDLKQIVSEAHDDARLRIKKAYEISLDPIDENEAPEEVERFDPTKGYPEIFDMTTLKGYFGEIFAGVIAENYSPFGENKWKVPVFSFRFHEIAFDQLEMYLLTGDLLNAIPGRTGDDCLAFVLQEDKIVKTLFCEAKCTASHNEGMISKAHEKMNGINEIPVEIRRLIELLKDYETPEAKKWIKALYKLRTSNGKDSHERFDLVSYVCGKSPIKPKTRTSWIPSDSPHSSYEAARRLESVEVHLKDVEDIINEVYERSI